MSPSNISKALKADLQTIHHSTMESYIGYLTESFVFYQAKRFDIKGKKQLATQEKYYTVDPGMLNVLVGRNTKADRSHILENVVYLELLRRGYEVWVGNLRNGEVDFVARDKRGGLEYYQVAWNISTSETKEREFAPLFRIKDNYPKYLLTTDSFPQGEGGIIHRNIFEWLLSDIIPGKATVR